MSSITRSVASEATLSEKRVRLVLEAEVWKDSEGGPDTLCVTTDQLACEPTCPARLLRMIEEAHAQLDAMKRIALEFEARDTLAAIVAEHHARLEEWDTADADPRLRDTFAASAYFASGQMVIVVPLGQDPIERTHFVVAAVNRAVEQGGQA